MSRAALEDAIAAWSATSAGVPQDVLDERILVHTAMLRAIAERGLATAEELAEVTGRPPVQMAQVFQNLGAAGIEIDDAGNIVGAALTVRRTPHRFTLGDRELYAWCALDALFLPGLLDRPAEVSSHCPVSKEQIRLTVTPDGVTDCTPSSAVLSIVLPGTEAGGGTGPASPT